MHILGQGRNGDDPNKPRIKMPDALTDEQGYHRWKHQQEGMAEQMFGYGISIACPKHPKPQFAPRPCMACDHCEQQDEVHPDGIFLMPRKFFLCKKCLDLYERNRFDLGYDLKIRCRLCIKTEILRINKINPTLCDDLGIPH